ncbi:hypothetical protein HKCCSP123_15765 [Rhodobacterales bacterium HKCCSP123]|nr:hypothetical protein [Rhodobacterales bacterium HKCCSP123]
MPLSTTQIKTFRKRLISLSPPEEVLLNFDSLIEISTAFETEDSLDELLRDACRGSNWTKPWEPEGTRLTFRASKLRTEHPEYKSDTGGENTPAEEQCYRRGFSHGFNHARQAVKSIAAAEKILNDIEKSVFLWRRAELHDRESLIWGSIIEPDYSCKVQSTAKRSGLSLKTRYEVLERDGRRCVICGVSTRHDAVLEVDHIVPVAKGGSDDRDNLQTLCFDCNRGKGPSSI